jgi:hypothetical protein
MRAKLAIAAVLAVLAGTLVASVTSAAPSERSSTLRPWGKGPATGQATTEAATPKGATRLVIFGQEADFTGGTGRFKQARGQLHETFLPPDRFRFAFTLYL